MDVVILDKQLFPREKPCGGWITPPVAELLGLDLHAYASEFVCQPITGFGCGMIGGKATYVKYDDTISYGIRRWEFDHYLLQRCGARTFLGRPVHAIARANDIWQVNEEFAAPMLVGAAGHFCPVARLLGARESLQACVVTAQEVEFSVSAESLAQGFIDAETPELSFCRDLQGYGWCFRKGNYLNIGLGRLDNRRLSSHVAEFCRLLLDSHKVTCEIPSHFRGHAYQLYERVCSKWHDDGVLLVGDAAGVADAQSGEGIRPAIESGLIAADVIRDCQGHFAPARLAEYEKRIRQSFGRSRHRTLSNWLPAGWLHALGTRLLATPWFLRRVVMDRWFLHRNAW
jgi:flavin-dependent dehydrogenase